MKLIAHRGHSKKYPENTMLAFRNAVEVGADGIEFDVHFTKDKKVIIHHFYYLGNTDNGEGRVFEKDTAFLRSLDAGSWFGKEFKGEKMPLLEEVLQEFGDKTIYEIELKGFGKEYIDSVLKLVQEHKLLNNVKFSSFQYPLLSYVKKQLPQATVGFIAPPIPDWMDEVIAREFIKSHLLLGEIDVIHAPVKIYDQNFVEELHSMGLKVHFGLCDTEEDLKKAVALGADELTTNDIELAVKVVK